MHYTIERMDSTQMLETLRGGKVINEMNLVFFSTSGVHGTYATIEDIEKGKIDQLTCTFYFPRTCTLRYGVIYPKPEDIPMLKRIRQENAVAASGIGFEHNKGDQDG